MNSLREACGDVRLAGDLGVRRRIVPPPGMSGPVEAGRALEQSEALGELRLQADQVEIVERVAGLLGIRAVGHLLGADRDHVAGEGIVEERAHGGRETRVLQQRAQAGDLARERGRRGVERVGDLEVARVDQALALPPSGVWRNGGASADGRRTARPARGTW